MKRRNKETYLFQQFSKKQYLISWIIICPLYFFALKNWCLIPLAEVLSVDVTTDYFTSVIVLLRNTLILLLLCIVFGNVMKASLCELRQKSIGSHIRWLGKGFGYYLVSCMMSGVVFVIAYQIMEVKLAGQTSQNQMIVDAFWTLYPVLAFISNVIVAPIVEEYVFRGIIFHTLRRVHVIIAIVGSSVIFGLLHVYREILAGDAMAIVQMVPYLGTAFALAFLYEKRRNIILCIILHMLVNLISLIL